MGEPAPPEIVANALRDRLVLAENHAARERCLRRRQARRDSALRPFSHEVEQVRDAASPPSGRAGIVEEELARDAAPA